MKVLLDECVPWPIYKILVGHECTPVQRQGGSGIKNGALLSLAVGQFDLLITSDQSLSYQQNLGSHDIAILMLSTNKLRRIEAAAELLRATVESMQSQQFLRLDIP